MRLVELGRTTYADSYAAQKEALAARIAGTGPDTLIVCEHEPVITVGRSRGARDNVLLPGDWPVVEVERGGDVTWHGPGQLVAYPVVALPEGQQDLHRHLHQLEEAAIRTCTELGLPAHRDDRNTGAWIRGRKVCSIGIACRRWVTWHGLALNVDPDLGAFSRIHPCGFDASVMTTMAVEADRALPLGEVQSVLIRHLRELLPWDSVPG